MLPTGKSREIRCRFPDNKDRQGRVVCSRPPTSEQSTTATRVCVIAPIECTSLSRISTDGVDRLHEASPGFAARIANYWLTELQGEVVDKCLQLHGGWGYINEYPIAKMFRDSRVTRIFGGSNEIMKMLIARSM